MATLNSIITLDDRVSPELNKIIVKAEALDVVLERVDDRLGDLGRTSTKTSQLWAVNMGEMRASSGAMKTGVNDDLREIRQSLMTLTAKRHHINVDADTAMAHAKIRLLKKDLATLNNKGFSVSGATGAATMMRGSSVFGSFGSGGGGGFGGGGGGRSSGAFSGVSTNIGPVGLSGSALARLLPTAAAPAVSVATGGIGVLTTAVTALGVSLVSVTALTAAFTTGIAALALPISKVIGETADWYKKLDQANDRLEKTRSGTKAYKNALYEVNRLQKLVPGDVQQIIGSYRDLSKTWREQVTNGASGQRAFSIVNDSLLISKELVPLVASQMDRFTLSGVKMFRTLKSETPAISRVMDATMARWPTYFEQSGEALGHLSLGLMGLLRGATPMTNAMSQGFLDMTTRFDEWANSMDGQRDMRKFFSDLIPVGADVVDLLGRIGRAAGAVAGDPKMIRHTRDFLDLIGDFVDKLPPFITEMTDASSALGPLVRHVTRDVGEFVTDVAPALDKLYGSFSNLLEISDGLPKALQPIANMIILGAAFKSVGLISSGVFRLGKGLGSLVLLTAPLRAFNASFKALSTLAANRKFSDKNFLKAFTATGDAVPSPGGANVWAPGLTGAARNAELARLAGKNAAGVGAAHMGMDANTVRGLGGPGQVGQFAKTGLAGADAAAAGKTLIGASTAGMGEGAAKGLSKAGALKRVLPGANMAFGIADSMKAGLPVFVTNWAMMGGGGAGGAAMMAGLSAATIGTVALTAGTLLLGAGAGVALGYALNKWAENREQARQQHAKDLADAYTGRSNTTGGKLVGAGVRGSDATPQYQLPGSYLQGNAELPVMPASRAQKVARTFDDGSVARNMLLNATKGVADVESFMQGPGGARLVTAIQGAMRSATSAGEVQMMVGARRIRMAFDREMAQIGVVANSNVAGPTSNPSRSFDNNFLEHLDTTRGTPTNAPFLPGKGPNGQGSMGTGDAPGWVSSLGNMVSKVMPNPVANTIQSGLQSVEGGLSTDLAGFERFGDVGRFVKGKMQGVYANAKNRLLQMSQMRAAAPKGAAGAAAGSGGEAGPMFASANFSSVNSVAKKLGLQVTSTTGGKHAPNSWHYDGNAVDYSNGFSPTPEMDRFYKSLVPLAQSGAIGQLIYKNDGWQNGQHYNYGASDHFNHVHVGIRGSQSTGGGSDSRTGDAPANFMSSASSRVTPRKSRQSSGDIHIDMTGAQINSDMDLETIASELARKVKYHMDNLPMEDGTEVSH